MINLFHKEGGKTSKDKSVSKSQSYQYLACGKLPDPWKGIYRIGQFYSLRSFTSELRCQIRH